MIKKKKILIIGGSGFLASYWIEILNKYNNEIILLINHRVNNLVRKFEYYDYKKIKNLSLLFEEKKFDLIINTASIANVELCENKPLLAKLAHENLVKTVVNATKKINGYLVHISTDHLFSGKNKLYKESSNTRPLNNYSKTKLNSEKIIIKSKLKKYLIIRGNFFGFGPTYKKTLLDWIIDSVSKNKKIILYDDIYFSPLYVTVFISMINRLIVLEEKGIFNVSSTESISKYNFALNILKITNLDKKKIHSGSGEKLFSVKRPLNMSLSPNKILKKLKIKKNILSQNYQNKIFGKSIKSKIVQTIKNLK